MKRCFLLIVGLAAACSSWAEDTPVKEPITLDWTGFQAGIFDVGPAFVSGQPTDEALRKLVKEQKVTTVVSVRTKEEMDDRKIVPFDEPALLKELGVRYVNLPIGKCSPDLVKRFSDEMSSAKGKVLLHCTVAWRASYMWMAYLVTYRKQTVDDAWWKSGMKMSVTVDRTALMLDSEVSYMAQPHVEGARKPKEGVISKPGSKIKITSPKAVNPPGADYMAFTMWDLGGILNASQPDEAKLRELAKDGVKTIVNLRTPEEMATLKARGFDEEAVAKELGMKYVNVPISNYKSFTPEALDQLAKAFEEAEGKILYHCQSATRTTQALVPYLVKHQGMTLDEATKVGEAMRWNFMFQELLNADFQYLLKPKSGE